MRMWPRLLGLLLLCGAVLEISCEEFDFGAFVMDVQPPTSILYGKYSTGNVFREQNLRLDFDSLEESTSDEFIDGDPNVIRRYASANFTWSYAPFSEPVDGQPNVTQSGCRLTARIPNGGNFTLEFSVFDQDVALTLGPETVNILANAIKLSFSSNFYPFKAATTHIRIRLVYGFIVPIGTLNIQSDKTPDQKLWMWNITSDKLEIKANFQGWALVDGGFVYNDWDPFSLDPREEGLLLSQRYMWPRFTNSLIYDPDFRLLVLGNDPSLLAPDAAGAAPVPPWVYAVAIVPVAAFAAVGSWIVFYRIRQKRLREAQNLKSKIAQNILTPHPAQPVVALEAHPSAVIAPGPASTPGNPSNGTSTNLLTWSAYRPPDMHNS